MTFTFLSNKGSPAPLVYIALHISLVGALIYTHKSMIEFRQNPEVILFWLIALLNLLLYFRAHLRDPGYVSLENTHYTDQENPSPNKITRKRMDSIMRAKLHEKKGNIKLDGNQPATDVEMKEGINEMNKDYFLKLGQQRTTSISTNCVMLTNTASDVMSTDKKVEGRTEHPEMNDYNEESANKDAKDPDDIVACEQSMDVNEESMQQQNIINFNMKSTDDVDILGEYSMKKNPTKREGNTLEKIEQNRINEEFQDEKETPDGEDEERQEQRQERSYEQENDGSLAHRGIDIYEAKKDDRAFSDTEQKADDYDTRLKIEGKLSNILNPTKKKGYLRFKDEESIAVQGRETPHKDIPQIDLVSPVHRALDVNHENDLMKSTERRLISHDDTSRGVEGNKKRVKGTGKQKKNEIVINSRKLDEGPEMEDLEKQQIEKEEDILYVERRYCTVCGREQPLRAKHCKECERCVSQYDHHCPWLGTCIGERNHLAFYWFLVFQLIEFLWGEAKVLEDMFTKEYEHWFTENGLRIILAIFFTFFIIMIFSLICFHTYLAFVNLTTWESLSWYKISYLREWHEDWGSPFSEGVIKNLKFFCCTSKKVLRRWEMPKYKRPLDEQNIKH